MNFRTQWTVYRTRFLVRARQLTEPLVFTDALGCEQYGQPGDYLVEFSDGVQRIATQALFEDVYVPLSPRMVQKDGLPGVLDQPLSRASPSRRTRASA